MTIRCQTVQVMGSGQAADVQHRQEYGDEPGIGQYYGEQIDVILSLPEAPGQDIDRVIGEIQVAFGEIAPYKVLTVRYAHIQKQPVVDDATLQAAIRDMATEIEQVMTWQEGHKVMTLIFTSYWRQGDAYATIMRVGKYIYSYLVMRNGLNPYPVGIGPTLKHEINHLLGLRGDNGFPTGNTQELANETASDYIYAGGMQPAWMASDELKAITHLKFDNGVEYGEKLFGCRDGKRIPWYHKYTNTPTPHREYSATWEEVARQVDGINSGQTVNRNVC